jgi:hypothetical protein
MSIIVVGQDLNDAFFARCDYKPCSKMVRCRLLNQNGQNQVVSPVGWVTPRLSGQVVANNGVQVFTYCCLEHEMLADGLGDETRADGTHLWEDVNLAEPPNIVKAPSDALDQLEDAGILSGHRRAPSRLMDARR